MLQKFITIAAWGFFAFIAYSTISPIQARPTLPTSPGLEHFFAFAVLGGLFCLAYPESLIFVFVVVIGGAALLEIAQLLTPDRHARLADCLQKMAGGAFGILILWTTRRFAAR
jgi:hypothetical protein